MFKFSPATSFIISCDTQEEIDHYWNKLGVEGGKTSQCGWLDDKFGVTWQVVPAKLGEWISEPGRAKRVMQALMPMTKLILKDLQTAFDGK